MKQVFLIIAILLFCSNCYRQVGSDAVAGRISNSIEEFHARYPLSNGNTIELVGWSDAGLVAYLDSRVNIYLWYMSMDLVIFDATRDAIIERVSAGDGTDYSLFFDRKKGPVFKQYRGFPALSSKKAISETLRNWNKALERNDIRERIDNFNTPLAVTQLHAFPLIQEGKTFDSWFEIVAEEEGEEDSFAINSTWSLMGSNGTQTKIISSGEEITYMVGGYVGSTVLGYFKSPYENMLVVIAAHHIRIGDDIHHIELYGFHLDTGFN